VSIGVSPWVGWVVLLLPSRSALALAASSFVESEHDRCRRHARSSSDLGLLHAGVEQLLIDPGATGAQLFKVRLRALDAISGRVEIRPQRVDVGRLGIAAGGRDLGRGH
jgi:hypothetical protein